MFNVCLLLLLVGEIKECYGNNNFYFFLGGNWYSEIICFIN